MGPLLYLRASAFICGGKLMNALLGHVAHVAETTSCPRSSVLLFVWLRGGSATREDIERFRRFKRNTAKTLADLRGWGVLSWNSDEDRYFLTEPRFWRLTPEQELPADWAMTFRLPQELAEALAAGPPVAGCEQVSPATAAVVSSRATGGSIDPAGIDYSNRKGKAVSIPDRSRSIEAVNEVSARFWRLVGEHERSGPSGGWFTRQLLESPGRVESVLKNFKEANARERIMKPGAWMRRALENAL
jgi:hypothetical protein